MNDYKPVPAGAIKLELDHWHCGDVCSCQSIRIMAQVTNTPHWCPADVPYLVPVWESFWFHPDEEEPLIQELREKVEEACKHYGLTPILEGGPWDWEGTSQLPVKH
jgi:hypothetical protein